MPDWRPASQFVPEGSSEDYLRVLVVADDPLVRAGLKALLEGFPAFNVVGQIGPGTGLEQDLQAYSPEVVVWDLGWEGEGGLDPLSEADWSDLPLVVLLSDGKLARGAWTAGARGLLPRDVTAGRLAATLSAVVEGLAVIDPAMVFPLLPGEAAPKPGLIEPLTARELEVLRLMADGLPNKAIAVRLEISEFTVKFHVNSILGKLGAQSRTEAAMNAARMGLIPL